MKHRMNQLWKNLFYAGLDPKEYDQIKGEVTKSNVQNLQIFTVVAITFLMVMVALSYWIPDVRMNRWLYFVPMPMIIALFFISKYCPLKETHILICIYTFVAILYGFGCVLGTIADPDDQTVTFVALLLTVPLLFTDRPIRMIVINLIFMLFFVIIAVLYKEKVVLAVDVMDVCVFGTISAVVGCYMMKVKCQRYFYEYEVAVLSEMDLLTELNNRNSFEQRLNAYPALCNHSLGCIYADANGLHALNNTKGHEAGDQMLKMIAKTLKEQFGARDVYRIGGDEFVAFAIDHDPACLQKKISAVQRLTEEHDYHVSIGSAQKICAELDMDLLLKEAEKEMYAAKKRYYERLGKTDTMHSSLGNRP